MKRSLLLVSALAAAAPATAQDLRAQVQAKFAEAASRTFRIHSELRQFSQN